MNKDLFSQVPKPVLKENSSVTLNCAKIRTDALVKDNPLSSAEALKQTKELAMNSQEKAKLVNQSPIQKSLFDFKGNSRHKI